MRESHRRIQERFPRRSLELPPLFGQRPPPAAACLRLQFGQSFSSSATAASVALDTNRNSARPALQNRRSHSSNCALHPGSSRHGLALASPVRQTRAGPQYQLAASCVANPLVSHVKGGACSKDCLPPSPCSTSSSLRSFNASRDDSKAKKPKIPTAERQNFNCRELSRLVFRLTQLFHLVLRLRDLFLAGTSGEFPNSFTSNSGFTRARSTVSPQCKCGPVTRPVAPTFPSTAPASRASPAFTSISER